MQTVAKARMVILVSGKLNFQVKNLPDTGTLYTDKRINSLRRYNYYSHTSTKHQSSTMYKANIYRIEEETHSCKIIDFNTPLSIMDKNNQDRINKKRQTSPSPTGLTIHVLMAPSNSRIHIFLRCVGHPGRNCWRRSCRGAYPAAASCWGRRSSRSTAAAAGRYRAKATLSRRGLPRRTPHPVRCV